MTWKETFIFRSDARHIKLTIITFLCSGLSSVYVSAQVDETAEAIRQGSRILSGSSVNELLAFIACCSMALCGWVMWMFFKSVSRITEELKGRPCFYKVAEKEARTHEKYNS